MRREGSGTLAGLTQRGAWVVEHSLNQDKAAFRHSLVDGFFGMGRTCVLKGEGSPLGRQAISSKCPVELIGSQT